MGFMPRQADASASGSDPAATVALNPATKPDVFMPGQCSVNLHYFQTSPQTLIHQHMTFIHNSFALSWSKGV
jgi:hypothetical protein